MCFDRTHPVVVAVLLDEFLMAMKMQQADSLNDVKLRCKRNDRPCLEGLMAKLIHFRTYPDLRLRIHECYVLLDADCSGSISVHEVNEGFT
jgi:hypothetical protein